MGNPTDRPPPAVTQDLEPLEDDDARVGPTAGATMAQTGEEGPADPSSTLLFDDEDEDAGADDGPARKPARAGSRPRRSAATPAAPKQAVTRATPHLQPGAGAKPPIYRRNVLAPGDAFESTEPDPPPVAPAQPSFRELWAVTIGGSRVTIIELILAVLALVIFAGVAWLFL